MDDLLARIDLDVRSRDLEGGTRLGARDGRRADHLRRELPERAARASQGGRVQLECTVQPNLSLVCGVASETPPGMGFGRAALGAANAYRSMPQLSDGSSAVGARTRVAFSFQPPAR